MFDLLWRYCNNVIKVWIISVGPVAFLLLLLLQVEPLVIWSVVIIALRRCGEPFSRHPRWCWPSGSLRHQCRHHSGWQVHLWLSCQNPHLPQRYVTASLSAPSGTFSGFFVFCFLSHLRGDSLLHECVSSENKTPAGRDRHVCGCVAVGFLLPPRAPWARCRPDPYVWASCLPEAGVSHSLADPIGLLWRSCS